MILQHDKETYMRKTLFVGIAVLSLSLVTPMATWAEENKETVSIAAQIETMKEAFIGALEPKTMYTNRAGVNIREKPDIESRILDQSLLNTSFEVIGEHDGWSMITTADGYAFIKSDYLSDTETSLEYLGKFKISHYCCEPYKHICGDGKGLTRTGIPVHPGLISVDSCVIPLGSTVIIDGIEYQAEDTGGMIKGNKIDMAVETHHEALDLGVYWADVYIIGTK